MENIDIQTPTITSSKNFLIAQELPKLREFNSRNFIVLERLCKKIDLTKRVLKVYNQDFLTLQEQQEELSRESYLELGEILLLWAEEKKDYKFLNSCFKLADLLEEHSLTQKAQNLLGRMQ